MNRIITAFSITKEQHEDLAFWFEQFQHDKAIISILSHGCFRVESLKQNVEYCQQVAYICKRAVNQIGANYRVMPQILQPLSVFENKEYNSL